MIGKLLEKIIFGSKWLLLVFYLGLILAQIFYCIKFCQEVFNLSLHFWSFTEVQLMLAVLTLIDITMIANLIKMIISGSYQTFLKRTEDIDLHQNPESVSSSILKIKMGSSLIGVSSIHLLQVFINSSGISNQEVIIKVGIHLVFLFSTVGLAVIDYLHRKDPHSPIP